MKLFNTQSATTALNLKGLRVPKKNCIELPATEYGDNDIGQMVVVTAVTNPGRTLHCIPHPDLQAYSYNHTDIVEAGEIPKITFIDDNSDELKELVGNLPYLFRFYLANWS